MQKGITEVTTYKGVYDVISITISDGAIVRVTQITPSSRFCYVLDSAGDCLDEFNVPGGDQEMMMWRDVCCLKKECSAGGFDALIKDAIKTTGEHNVRGLHELYHALSSRMHKSYVRDAQKVAVGLLNW